MSPPSRSIANRIGTAPGLYVPPNWWRKFSQAITAADWDGTWSSACKLAGISVSALKNARQHEGFLHLLKETMTHAALDMAPEVLLDTARRALKAGDEYASRYSRLILGAAGLLDRQQEPDRGDQHVHFHVEDRAQLRRVIEDLRASGDLPEA